MGKKGKLVFPFPSPFYPKTLPVKTIKNWIKKNRVQPGLLANYSAESSFCCSAIIFSAICAGTSS
jgi:hypothetical protein